MNENNYKRKNFNGRKNDRADNINEERDDENRSRSAEKHSDLITGRNAVMEALRSDRPIECIMTARTSDGNQRSLGQIIAMAKDKGITVKDVSPVKLDAMCSGSHQGVAALAAVHEYSTVEAMLGAAENKGESPFIIICDCIEDPHNLGAIIRSAEAAGAHGVIIPKRRAVGLTWAVGKSSAGALEYMPVARVANLSATIEELKKKGLWVYCADMDGQPWCSGDLTGPIALVIGGEDNGVSRLVKEKCDGVLSMPMCGSINSLNASVAGALLMYEITRQRNGVKAYNGFIKE